MESTLNAIIYNDIVSTDTCYGLIWSGSYQLCECIIKLVLIKTKSVPVDIPNYNDQKPFYHSLFKDKKVMSKHDFQTEVTSQEQLSMYGLSPHIKAFGIFVHPCNLSYGYIVMEKWQMSLKMLLLQRDLDFSENQLIESMIIQLHQNCYATHGDLKPSNIGINLDHGGKISRVCFFDCQKVRFKKDLSHRQFKKNVKSNWANYRKHIDKNLNDRQILKNESNLKYF